MQQYDFIISYQREGLKHKLPYAFNKNIMTFSWELPHGVEQESYIFEMRTAVPVLYSDGKTYRCAYYSSARVNSSQNYHHIDFIGNESLNLNTWAGVCEIRLRIFNKNNVEYCTHDEITDGTRYDFELDHPQYRYWGSKNDGYYFCLDYDQDNGLNKQEAKLSFFESEDFDENQVYKYKIQISNTPLFGQGKIKNENLILVEKDNIDQEQILSGIIIKFQNEKDPSKWIEDSINSLKPNTLYYARVRCYDGYDYSEWSRVSAFKMVLNFVPIPKLLNLYYPANSVGIQTDKNITLIETQVNINSISNSYVMVQQNRNKGQVIIELQVQDDDDDYVIGSLCYSIGDEPLNYNSDSTKLKRINTNETLFKIPTTKITNQKIRIVWNTINDLEKQKNNVYLYFCVSDKFNEKVEYNSNKYIIDNSNMVDTKENAVPSFKFWIDGECTRNHVFPVLPDRMIRQTLSGVKINSSSQEEKPGNIGETSGTKNSGSNIFEFWKKYEDGGIEIDKNYYSKRKYGIERITQTGGFTINNYGKYPEGQVLDSGEIKIDLQGYVPTTETIQANKGFVMFCPYCDELKILKNYILYKGERYTIEEFAQLFIKEDYDGTPYKLVFECPSVREHLSSSSSSSSLSSLSSIRENKDNLYECKKSFDMNIKYQEDLSYKIGGAVRKNSYSYYNGYNSDFNYLNDTGLSESLKLSLQSEYNKLKSQWEKQNKPEENSALQCPYTFELIEKGAGKTWETLDKEGDYYGFMPAYALLNLKNRPEIGSYLIINPPKTKNYEYAPYYDGTKLNANVNKDYMFGYEPTQKGDGITQSVEKDSGDLSLQALAKQSPWNLKNPMIFKYIQGKKGIEFKENYEKGNSTPNSPSVQEDNTSKKEDSIYHVCFSDCNNVSYEEDYKYEQGYYKYQKTIIYNRASFYVKINFPLMITKGVNDRFKILINDEQIIQGSILRDGINYQACYFPFNEGKKDSQYYYDPNEYHTYLFGTDYGYLTKIFGGFCDTSIFRNDNEIDRNLTQENFDKQYIDFIIYGKNQKKLKKIEILSCENSCYNLFNLKRGVVYQSYCEYNSFLGEYDGFIHRGYLPTDETEETSFDRLTESNKKIGITCIKQSYYYTREKHQLKSYDFEESPIDNTIETDFGCLSTVSNGQPLFTCYKDEVDKDGYHFKFNEEDFKKTKKIYVRCIHTQPCYPFPDPGLGYRNWMVFPIEGKDGRYYKKKVVNHRGINAIQKFIKVIVNNKEIQQIGYFNPDGESCISHDLSKLSTQDNKFYERKKQELPTWRNKLYPKTCIVFDYVDITNAITKNIVDMEQGLNPFTHKCFMILKSNFFKYVQPIIRHGVYVMGGYDLTDEQKTIDNDGKYYEKTFSSCVTTDENGNNIPSSWVEYTELMPNNWRPLLINSIFTIDKNETVNVSIIEQKKDEIEYEIKQINSYDKYRKYWQKKINNLENSQEFKNSQLSQYTVQQFAPNIIGRLGIYQKWGYQPQHKVQTYWKVNSDDVNMERYIPLTTTLVHNIYNDPFADERILGHIITERKFISDKSFMRVDPEEYDRLPYLDYRLLGKINYNIYQYFSGYPHHQHPGYLTRPEPPYDYDRQMRIGGINRTANYVQNGYPEYNSKYQYPYGAVIDFLTVYGDNSRFYYLQDEWNSYNRIHWRAMDNIEGFYVLYAQQVSGQNNLTPIGEEFNVKTYSSIWKKELNVWVIPYNRHMTDMVDTKNSLMQNEKYYIFILKSINEHGLIIETIQSKIFKISKRAISPVTIVSTEYDPWSKNLTINFRFDDELGRKYDLVGMQYSVDKENTTGIYNEWEDVDLNVIDGNIYDLSSNLYGDNVPNKNLIIIHKIVVNVGQLSGIQATNALRIQLFSALSMNRMGMTYPTFNVTMWANEFLKPIEERLRFLQGYKTRWVYNESNEYNEETEEIQTVGKWNYVDQKDAIIVPGSIQIEGNKITEIENEFNNKWNIISKFRYSDYDAFEQWINVTNQWDLFYYTFVFDKYITLKSYTEQYQKFKKDKESKNEKEIIIKKSYLYQFQYNVDFNEYYYNNKISLLQQFKNETDSENKTNSEKFLEWHRNIQLPSYEQVRQKYIIEKHLQKFNLDYNISSSSSSSIVLEDNKIVDFIINNNLVEDFIKYYAISMNSNPLLIVYYADTRFEQRAWIMYEKFGVETEGLWYSNSSNSSGYDVWIQWLENNDEKYNNISDKYIMFLSEQNKNNVINYGKSIYRNAFLQLKADNSLTYGQKYQAINRELESLHNELNEKKTLKIKLETDYRINLIKQGYFCNGFENNKPYRENGKVNTCFRWRVETRIYEGSLEDNIIYDEEGNTELGYQTRFDMYLRFQMDFYNTFDSQNGLPLRDIIYLNGVQDDDNRILMSINNSNSNIKTHPDEVIIDEQKLDIPNDYFNSIINSQKSYQENSNLQFNVSFSLLKKDLPGRKTNDYLPDEYEGGWAQDRLLQKNSYVPQDSFKSIYYWRVAPYNLLDRPVFESFLGEIKQNESLVNNPRYITSFIIDNVKPNEFIKHNTFIKRDKGEIYFATSLLTNPIWKSSIYSIIQNNDFTNTIYDVNYNDWINIEMLKRGEVQFVTDRPRKIYFEEETSSSSQSSSFLDTNNYYENYYNVSIDNSQFYTYNKMVNIFTNIIIEGKNLLVPVYFRRVENNNNVLYLYCAVYKNEANWFISRTLPKYKNLSPKNMLQTSYSIKQADLKISGFTGKATELTILAGKHTTNDVWLYKSNSNVLFPNLNSNDWFIYGSVLPNSNVIIEAPEKMESSSSETISDDFFKKAKVEYIEDNLDNYNTTWYPYSPIRKKPFVLRLKNKYLMFCHKLKSSYYAAKLDTYLSQNVITLSIGYSNNLFGEQQMCFPNYNYQLLSDVIPMPQNSTLVPFSFENPCVIDLNNGKYRMYFNVKFYDNNSGNITTEIYKTDTYDFDVWFDFQKINMNINGIHNSDSLQPFVNIKIQENSSSSSDSSDNSSDNSINYIYQMYISSKLSNQEYFTIKHYISYDGINFEYQNNINFNGYYNCCSPCLYEDEYMKKLYFTIISSADNNGKTSEIIVSLDLTINDAKVIIQKGPNNLIGEQFNGSFSSYNQEDILELSHYSNPCVIRDLDYGLWVQRMYYNTYDTPYLWYEKELVPGKGVKELTIHSEYLEKYEWKSGYYWELKFQKQDYDTNKWTEISMHNNNKIPNDCYIKYSCSKIADEDGYNFNYHRPIYAIKVFLKPANTLVTCLSQGNWIGFDNYMNTQAILSPQYIDYNYDIDKYTPMEFIFEYNLFNQYNEWISSSSGEYENTQSMELQFILQKKYYPQYLWWSKKGPCIYRYVGFDIMKNEQWEGDE